MITSALIGHTGFVGGNLKRQHIFTDLYNSKNINEIQGKSYDLLVCAGAPAVKWLANQKPAEDYANLKVLMNCLDKVKAKEFILISTIDVYPNPVNVSETTKINSQNQQPYGRHRHELEIFSRLHFDATIIRLPGLFGPGLKKNVIFDLLTNHRVEHIHPLGYFQYYDLNCLWQDIGKVITKKIKLINFATEPIVTQDLAQTCFERALTVEIAAPAPRYLMKSNHSSLWNRQDGYLYGKDTVMQQLKRFVLSYRRALS